MAKVLILGGGFGGVVAAERLAKQLGEEHQITLISRSRQFIFYPALVRQGRFWSWAKRAQEEYWELSHF